MSIGYQLGGQAFREIIFFEDQRAYDEFTRGTFEFDANASAVVFTAGAQAQAGTMGATAGASAGPSTGKQAGASYYKGMAVFVHARGGLMVEAAKPSLSNRTNRRSIQSPGGRPKRFKAPLCSHGESKDSQDKADSVSFFASFRGRSFMPETPTSRSV
jgi:hypothetical protein